MEFGFESFGSGFSEFDTDIEEVEVKKEKKFDRIWHIKDAISEDRYKSKKSETVSLSDYHVTSEYSTKSEYEQKSDYDTHCVIFEGAAEENNDLPELKFESLLRMKF